MSMISLGKVFYWLYGINDCRIRNIILKLISKVEGGELYSRTLRRIFEDYYKVKVGMYTHGGCFVPGQIDKFTSIGRYCSIAGTVRVMNRDHPMDFKSTHGLFFNPDLKLCDNDMINYIPLYIGNDVWIGHNAIIAPHVRTIGDGAVIGAGAVVHNDVYPYAVVVGNPARPVRYRFRKEVVEELLASRWWEKSIEEIEPHVDEFRKSYGKALKEEQS